MALIMLPTLMVVGCAAWATRESNTIYSMYLFQRSTMALYCIIMMWYLRQSPPTLLAFCSLCMFIPGAYIIRHETTPLPTIFVENYLLWFVPYAIAHLVLYVKPQRKLFAPFKFNPKYPPGKLVLKEFFRSARAVFICSLYMHGIYTLHARGVLPAFPGAAF